MSGAVAPARSVSSTGGHPRKAPAPQRLLFWRRLVLSTATGLLGALAFPPYDLWFSSIPALAGLVLLCRGQRLRTAALLGFAHGLTLFLVLLEWMRIIGPDAWVSLAGLEAGFYAVTGALLALVTRLPAWPMWVACVWVAEEAARATMPFGGFPWGRVAFAQTASPFTGYAALGGAPLVTFATGLTAALVAFCAITRFAPRRRAFGALLCALAIPAAGLLVVVPTDGTPTTVALVQGNVPRPGMRFLGEPEQVLRNHVAQTRALAAAVDAGRREQPDLVIWPENASDIDPFRDGGAYRLIDDTVRAIGVPVLVGAVVDGPGRDYISNTGVVWSPTRGPGARYVKRHPVPFGEYIPFRAQLSGRIERLEQIPRDFFAADRPGVLRVGPAVVGDVICFEVAYDGLVRDVVRGGAQVLVVQTNNATYNRTTQPPQQLAMSRLRAVEHGRAVLVAATSGISAVIAPDGEVVSKTSELTAATLVEQVPLRDGRTIADQLGYWPEWLLTALALAAAAVSGVRVLRARGSE